jgi:3-phenylpropionate/cinnamic acid dioxygenase small subunit
MSSTVGTPTATQPGPLVRYGTPVYNEIMGFLIEEAHLLDHDLFEEWIETLADDLVYLAPVRRTMRRSDGPGFDPEMMHFDDDLASLKLRVQRVLHTNTAYAEDPPSRVKRFLSTVLVRETEVETEYDVLSSVLVTRNRWSNPDVDLIPLERRDLFRRSETGWKLARRLLLLDHTLLGTSNLALFF